MCETESEEQKGDGNGLQRGVRWRQRRPTRSDKFPTQYPELENLSLSLHSLTHFFPHRPLLSLHSYPSSSCLSHKFVAASCVRCLSGDIEKKKNSSKLKRSLAMICWVFLILSFCYCEDESIDNLPHGFFNTQFSFLSISCSRARPLLVWIGKEKRGGKNRKSISRIWTCSHISSHIQCTKKYKVWLQVLRLYQRISISSL